MLNRKFNKGMQSWFGLGSTIIGAATGALVFLWLLSAALHGEPDTGAFFRRMYFITFAVMAIGCFCLMMGFRERRRVAVYVKPGLPKGRTR